MPKKGKDPKEVLKHTAIATLKGGAHSLWYCIWGFIIGGHDAK